MKSKTIPLMAALVLAAAPLALAHDGHSDSGTEPVGPNTHCWPYQNPHDYSVVWISPDRWQPRESLVPAVVVAVGDHNLEDCGTGLHPGDAGYDPASVRFDGDHEFGYRGGFFPAGIWAADPTCDYGLDAHHGPNFYVWSSFPDEATGFLARFTVGADPTAPELRPTTDPNDDDGWDCVTDGGVTPSIDVDDCLESFVQAGTTSCLPGGDGGWWVWTDCLPADCTLTGHIYSS